MVDCITRTSFPGHECKIWTVTAMLPAPSVRNSHHGHFLHIMLAENTCGFAHFITVGKTGYGYFDSPKCSLVPLMTNLISLRMSQSMDDKDVNKRN